MAADEVEFPNDYGKKQAKRGRPNLARNLVGKTLRKFQKRQKSQSTTPLPGIPEEEKKDEANLDGDRDRHSSFKEEGKREDANCDRDRDRDPWSRFWSWFALPSQGSWKEKPLP